MKNLLAVLFAIAPARTRLARALLAVFGKCAALSEVLLRIGELFELLVLGAEESVRKRMARALLAFFGKGLALGLRRLVGVLGAIFLTLQCRALAAFAIKRTSLALVGDGLVGRGLLRLGLRSIGLLGCGFLYFSLRNIGLLCFGLRDRFGRLGLFFSRCLGLRGSRFRDCLLLGRRLRLLVAKLKNGLTKSARTNDRRK